MTQRTASDLDLRFKNKEAESLRILAAAAGMSPTNYVRACLFSERPKERSRTTELQQLGLSYIARFSNNLNQLWASFPEGDGQKMVTDVKLFADELTADLSRNIESYTITVVQLQKLNDTGQVLNEKMKEIHRAQKAGLAYDQKETIAFFEKIVSPALHDFYAALTPNPNEAANK
ncbi:MAG: hypothetical protein COA78_34820 [Blastopirellula sp.]|nr:MAG: hypothetical protein COA78_34820 [Blastopirellula sp.]